MTASSDTAGDEVVLVDDRDAPIGVAPKTQVHRDGQLHRAVSVLLVDPDGRVLLQRRATAKYHSGGLWSNTCCGHPRPHEAVVDAAHRRLRAEMGIDRCDLTLAGTFVYHAELGAGLVEHELDHVVTGVWVGEPAPNAAEVADWAWVPRRELARDMAANPSRYTAWLRSVLHTCCP